MHPLPLNKLSLGIGLCLATSSAFASPQTFMSARSFAMGGTGVAVAHPSSAPAANPAMMAAEQHEWADDFGLMLPSINARAADEEKVVDQVDDIQDVIDQFDALVSKFNNAPGNTTAADVLQFKALAGDLNDRLTEFDRDTVRASIGLGLGVTVPGSRVSVGVFTSGNLTAGVRGELSDSDKTLLNDINDVNNTADAEAFVDKYKNTNGEIDFGSEGKILASAVVEVGVSLASSFSLNNGTSLQVGVTPKYVQLQTFQYTETVSGFEDDEFDGDQYQTDKSGFSLDIGAAYAFGTERQWNAGVVVKNLIPMELDSARSKPLIEQSYTLELKPVITAGIAHKGENHVITAELDLTKKEAFGFEDDTQWLAVGAEFDAWRYLQLRVGARQNLASNDDNDGIEEDTQWTAGLGLNIVGVRVDLGALFSSADTGAALELGTSF